MPTRLVMAIIGAASSAVLLGAAPASSERLQRVVSRDGTSILVECAGSGPNLLIVHGGTGDRTRWLPMFAYLERDFRVCAMDRRGHGQSGDGTAYSLTREAEDVAAVVNSRGGPVTVLGHSFGAVAAYEAAFFTPSIAGLIMYEPPIGLPDHSAALARIEALIAMGDREAATLTFFSDIVQQSPEEISAMKGRPSWPAIVASIEGSIRQDRALSARAWDAARAHRLRVRTLLLIGSRTTNPELRDAVRNLMSALPNAETIVLEGQQHNAMDTDRPGFAAIVKRFSSEVD